MVVFFSLTRLGPTPTATAVVTFFSLTRLCGLRQLLQLKLEPELELQLELDPELELGLNIGFGLKLQ